MSAQLTDPIGADEFAQLLESFPFFSASVPQKIAVAVSGGPDSLALAFCLKRWARGDLIAFIVDHGLRAESNTEVTQVKTVLEKIGIKAEILHWDHDPVTARLHEQARKARYNLLIDACHRYGISNLCIAHHREDQAETILMRLAKGSGIEGLSGMAKQSARDNVHILRPFLNFPKSRLVATCEAAQLSFVIDPSNKSEKFARGRLRKIMPMLAEEGLTIENLLTLGMRAGEASGAMDFYARGFLKNTAQCEIGGSIRIMRKALCVLPRAIALRALTLCLRYIHDSGHPPEYGALSALLDSIIVSSGDTVRTLYGCIISIAEEKLSILREPSAATESCILHAGETILWDKRWLVSIKNVTDGTQSYIIRALGHPQHDIIDQLAPTLRKSVPQGRVRASLPALWVEDRLVAIPSFEENAVFRPVRLKQSFP